MLIETLISRNIQAAAIRIVYSSSLFPHVSPSWLSMDNVPPPFEMTSPANVPSPWKALVWFWWIDKTLGANLVYQSDYEIGDTTPSDEAIVKIMWWWCHNDDQALRLEKKKEKNKRLKAKV